MNTVDPVDLCTRLIEFDTSNPPGHQMACVRYLGAMLAEAGFKVSEHPFGPDRLNLIARKGRRDAERSLCFVGHLDTVPAGDAAWRYPPFAATLEGSRLYGRGSCDMKSGVAAFVAAAVSAAPMVGPDAALTLLLTGGEETGCEGSSNLADQSPHELEGFHGVIVAEPTDNHPLLGHKGALWLRLLARGVAAHGAMPHLGVNAAVKAARMAIALQGFCAELPAHPVLGKPTLNIGGIRAGHAVNVVPDRAEIDVDIRTTPGLDHDELRKRLRELLLEDIDDAEVLVSLPGVFTEPESDWVKAVRRIAENTTGRAAALETADYFTDASALSRATGGAPILILGPGSPKQMHQTDEYCEVDQIREAERIYSLVITETLTRAPKHFASMAEQA